MKLNARVIVQNIADGLWTIYFSKRCLNSVHA